MCTLWDLFTPWLERNQELSSKKTSHFLLLSELSHSQRDPRGTQPPGTQAGDITYSPYMSPTDQGYLARITPHGVSPLRSASPQKSGGVNAPEKPGRNMLSTELGKDVFQSILLCLKSISQNVSSSVGSGKVRSSLKPARNTGRPHLCECLSVSPVG